MEKEKKNNLRIAVGIVKFFVKRKEYFCFNFYWCTPLISNFLYKIHFYFVNSIFSL